MTRSRIALAVVAATAVSTLAAEAAAQTAVVTVAPAAGPTGEGADRPGFSVAAQVGFFVGNGGYSNFATGVRGGYTFPFHLYVGGDATFYVAGTTVISLAPEVGYDIGLSSIPAVIRPYVGIGFVDVPGLPVGGGAAFEIYPGGEFLYSITREFFVGGDARIPLLFVSGATGVGLNLMGTVGYKF
jgi:hypothetical protein